jgi:hypothetical protein
MKKLVSIGFLLLTLADPCGGQRTLFSLRNKLTRLDQGSQKKKASGLVKKGKEPQQQGGDNDPRKQWIYSIGAVLAAFAMQWSIHWGELCRKIQKEIDHR